MSDSHPLRVWLEKQGVPERDFAGKLGVSKSYFSQILTGNRGARLDLALRIEDLTEGAVTARAVNDFRPQSTEIGEAAE